MKEIEPESKWDNPSSEPVDKLDKIIESNMVIIGFLSRLYDIQMAALNAVDKDTADAIYEMHEQGGNFNPPIFIPDIKEQ